ncbi:MAG: cytosine deaminase [Cyanobacteria bacterium REEB459]|nr:cytosine deaminase [Cyanobacteria bacterium REEB459]
MPIPDFLAETPPAYWLRNARLPLACLDHSTPWAVPMPDPLVSPLAAPLVAAHLKIEAGIITAIVPIDYALDPDQPAWDLGQGMVWPCFVDVHTHLDKGHIWPRQPNPDGTFEAALAGVIADRRQHWSWQELYPRMAFALRCSYAHGTQALRTHLDCGEGQEQISFALLQQLQADWADKLTLQGVPLVPIDYYDRPESGELVNLIADHGGILGAVLYPQPGLRQKIEGIFRLAQARGLDLDFHADESLDPQAEGLRLVAETRLKLEFTGQVTCGHCCSLSTQPEARAQETIDLVSRARIAVVSLPLCNLYLQDRRPGRTPRYRGVTLVNELDQSGAAVALASDNCRDPFFAYGDHDMVEVFTQSVRIGHLDHPLGHWPRAVTQTPAQIMGLQGAGELGVGRSADLVVLKARTFNEMLSRPQADRIVLRRGRAIDSTLPDYSELDELLASK